MPSAGVLLLGYEFAFTTKAWAAIVNASNPGEQLIAAGDAESDADSDADTNEWPHTACVDNVHFECDAEHNSIFVCFFSEYTAWCYSTFAVDCNALQDFYNKVAALQQRGLVPRDAVFGVHTYY